MTPKREDRARQVHALRLQGLTYREIGERFHISTNQARMDDQVLEERYSDAFCVEWEYQGKHCFRVGRAWDAQAARRKLGPYGYIDARVRQVSPEEMLMLMDVSRRQIYQERMWETDDRVQFAERVVASQGSE